MRKLAQKLAMLAVILGIIFSAPTLFAQKTEKQKPIEKIVKEKVGEKEKEIKDKENEQTPSKDDQINVPVGGKRDIGKDDDKDRDDENKPTSDKGKQKKEYKGKGNAYGRDKGGLSGKEFGQQRAADAKMNKDNTEREYNSTVEEAKTKKTEARTKIDEAKEELDKIFKNKKISKDEYELRKEKISKAEQSLMELEKKLK